MLNTQIQYWANVENKRHNIETETQTWEDLRRRELEYWQTVKYQSEQIGVLYDQLKETTRHNKAQEKIGMKQAKAAINSSIAAMRTASANLQNAYTNAKNATTKRKEYESTAKYQKAMSDKARSESQYKSKQTKYYVWSDVVPQYLNIGTKAIDAVVSSVTKSKAAKDPIKNIKKALRK